MNKLVDVKNVSISFKRKHVLEAVDCYLEQGEIVGLVGPNGAGKTTLMKVMVGFIPISKGGIMKTRDIAIEALIEQPGLYPFLSGLDHLQLFVEDRKTTEIDYLISLLDMNEFIGKKTKEYSLGMKQRLGIALALLNRPQVVILDEPMNGLDPYSVKLLKEAIITYRKSGTTFLISSHILSELEQLVDRVLLLKAGRVVENIEHPERLENFENDLLAKLA
ncbi:ABC transporter ATP-binding protein [Enterococcus sp.]|uniref:ABC transporter ATP-binding protein n=1 Tax=Enterococcus sp. TaxID=35783 RepID=UPI0029099A00|nr:ATP-binding cassette domain-containing protein [Enterococcus sp.]MDU5332923.1 ATP-binding cassette domain-containing protein [Enterococcus sp.]